MGRTPARSPVLKLGQDLYVRVIDAATGDLLREHAIETSRDYRPTGNDRWVRGRTKNERPNP